MVYLDAALLDRITASVPARQPGPVRFTHLAPRSPAAATCWNAARSYVAAMLADPQAAAQPLVTGNAATLLAAAALATFPNDALTDPTVTDRHDASAATVRRAAALIDEHAHEDIAAADIQQRNPRTASTLPPAPGGSGRDGAAGRQISGPQRWTGQIGSQVGELSPGLGHIGRGASLIELRAIQPASHVGVTEQPGNAFAVLIRHADRAIGHVPLS